jgi:S-adenosylmethionine/arginine decarboxylase-like enzyme
MDSWGFHLRLNAIGDKQKISDKAHMEDFSRTLVKAIEMIPYGEPQVYYFAEHDETKAGFTLIQLIMTSSITGHFVDATGEIYLDIFSCKPFNSEKAMKVANEFFEFGKNVNWDYTTRNAGLRPHEVRLKG